MVADALMVSYYEQDLLEVDIATVAAKPKVEGTSA
jgi:hypothetical protein